jgi:CO/xanthine dehydrogenase Mo-binding subunit
VLDKVLERMNWSKPFDKGSGSVRRGRGIAIAIKAVTSPTTSVAIVNVSADGSVTLSCGTVEMGQGSDTVMAQIVAEVLNIPTESIRVIPRDTDATPYDMGTLGSRSTFHMGHAVQRAATEARDKLKALARDVGEPEGSNIPIAELFQKRYGMQAGNVIGTGVFKPDYVSPSPEDGQSPKVTPFWLIAGGGAEVEVDTETGHVKILKLVNVVDCGKAINPKAVETQISGAAVMHIGFSMFEKMHFDGGQVTNASLADYKIPGMLDVPPDVTNEAVEAEERGGPFGAKGVGESGTFSVSPAVANALDDAVGVRLTSLPITAEAVYRAMKSRSLSPSI